jgi:hypothetical protein
MDKETSRIAEQVENAVSDLSGRPPIEKWHPELSGDMDMHIQRDGTWVFRGAPITREALVRLFSTILRREQDSHHYLVTPVEKWRVTVEDTPLLAHSLTAVGTGESQSLQITLNTGEVIPIGGDHSLHVGTYPESDEPRPVVDILHGLQARLTTAAFYDLAALAKETESSQHDGPVMGVWSNGVFFVLSENPVT